MNKERQDMVRRRFHLADAAVWHDARFTNLWWTLNGERFGFGDIRDKDIAIIQASLEKNEKFEGWNQHHGTEWQQSENPQIVITHEGAFFPPFKPVTKETRDKLKDEAF